jgi:hypothetical protein
MSQIQRKAFHFILYLLLETRCTKRKGDGLTSCTLNEQYEIQCSAYFAKSLLVRPRLATDEIGFVAIPKYTNTVDDKPLSTRAKRMVYMYN